MTAVETTMPDLLAWHRSRFVPVDLIEYLEDRDAAVALDPDFAVVPPVGGFALKFSERARAQLRTALRLSVFACEESELRNAVAGLFAELAHAPQKIGERLHRIRKLSLDIRHVTRDLLYVEFGVWEEVKEVVIRLLERA